jgi:hypothetical protein
MGTSGREKDAAQATHPASAAGVDDASARLADEHHVRDTTDGRVRRATG